MKNLFFYLKEKTILISLFILENEEICFFLRIIMTDINEY